MKAINIARERNIVIYNNRERERIKKNISVIKYIVKYNNRPAVNFIPRKTIFKYKLEVFEKYKIE